MYIYITITVSYCIGGDDLYIIMENLQYYLKQFDNVTETTPLYIGMEWISYMC